MKKVLDSSHEKFCRWRGEVSSRQLVADSIWWCERSAAKVCITTQVPTDHGRVECIEPNAKTHPSVSSRPAKRTSCLGELEYIHSWLLRPAFFHTFKGLLGEKALVSENPRTEVEEAINRQYPEVLNVSPLWILKAKNSLPYPTVTKRILAFSAGIAACCRKRCQGI